MNLGKMKDLFKWTITTLLILSFMSCSDDDGSMEEGSADVYITDAPVDNAEIEGVFVTVADVKVGGKSIEGFSEQTINLMDYQNGDTKLLGSGDFNVGSYNNVELVLNFATDANGDAPGCYALTTDQDKLDITSSSEATQNVVVSGAYDILADTKSNVVIDFNLRKAIMQNESGSQKYTLVAQSGLNAATRVVSKENSGSIEGTYDGSMESGEKVIVYAYKKGEFNESETQANSEGVLFAKAVNSAKVENGLSNSYTLSFLEEGEYELHFARYNENTSGEAAFEAMLDVESSGNVSINSITVEAKSKITLNISLIGVIS